MIEFMSKVDHALTSDLFIDRIPHYETHWRINMSQSEIRQ